ncbi:hypothetical protein TcasGA2_TC002156 [Tribolium castaneum]|uniref:Uncharacterized protein n=1 Tax=Tribolium castaneum TaxID=7070 RepID=D7EKU8_TRICA|nr:hypothetical protein TcasGA2_TC002156 [Tribolium castaneum]
MRSLISSSDPSSSKVLLQPLANVNSKMWWCTILHKPHINSVGEWQILKELWQTQVPKRTSSMLCRRPTDGAARRCPMCIKRVLPTRDLVYFPREALTTPSDLSNRNVRKCTLSDMVNRERPNLSNRFSPKNGMSRDNCGIPSPPNFVGA